VTEYREAQPDELERWDDLTVRVAGGHVLQSRAWADHRATKGWQPRYLIGDDGSAVLALLRPWPVVGGASAYVPRGPVPTAAVEDAIARLEGVTGWLAGEDVDVVASDAEVPAQGYRERIEGLGYRAIEEIQPSRHRLSVGLGPEAEEDAALENISKSTRQRLHKAERDGLGIVRHDPAASDGSQRPGGYADFEPPTESIKVALGRFHDLATQTADRRHFTLGSKESFLDWTTRAFAAGHLVLLLARSTRGPSTCSVGARSSWRSARVRTRWISVGSMSRARATSPGKASRCSACISTNAPSEPSGSSCPGRTSAS
jgi:hypothetical protein